ncbi:ATP-binding cassette domain-containing protein [Planosporangium thailandense]|uniref:ATP-binding cassette domain-containing protein n=1 Tax=Planosporangium thailandense TaxID=765197 RepID=A0ABX0XUY1_9ACTN|nr:ATP-binding cassette domain-containing protein [Planosporangium thailandense]NJC69205.1 ATP-binding cassette domain-containing protein [Planosporangium thailandense]
MDGTRRSESAAPIRLEAVSKRYADGTVAVEDLTLDLAAGETTVLIGPSGCGKSTVLRMVNRLIEPTSGRILVDGEDVAAADPVTLRRRIGYVIQQVGLFPHQTVRANVGTVPRLLGWSRSRIRERTDELLELVGLEPGRFGSRYPHELSGGQRQRVGVARALAADPVVLLMDEPFSAVDPIVRTRLQDEFRRLQETVRKTILLVTHDLDEAVRLGDRIAVLAERGRLQQYERPAALLAAPANDFVREFVGADRTIKRLGVTPIPRHALRPLPDGNDLDGAAGVPVEATLADALAALLGSDTGWVVVRDGTKLLGVLTPDDIHRALHAA